MHKSFIKSAVGILLSALAILSVIFQSFNIINSSAAEDYRLWRQQDARWANIQLGSSGETMSRSGCLVTSIAIMAVHSGAKSAENFNPGTLANTLNSINAFNGYGAIANWSSIQQAIPGVSFVKKYSFTSSTQSGKAAEMKQLSDSGYYLICNTGGHWVFIDSIVGSDVYMIDPAKNDIKLFEAYNISNITELRVFTGKNNSVNSTPAPTVPPTTKKTYMTGEYYNLSEADVQIYRDSDVNSDVMETLGYGQLVNITAVNDNWGKFNLGAEVGWIQLDTLKYAEADNKHTKGDINNDGVIDMIDLSLLNEYLISLSELPDGISILRECEILAADINEDTVVDNDDALQYLALICK